MYVRTADLFLKVSLLWKPQIEQFLAKLFFMFSDRSYCDLSIKKNLWKKYWFYAKLETNNVSLSSFFLKRFLGEVNLHYKVEWQILAFNKLFGAFSVCRLLIQPWICCRRNSKVRRKNHRGTVGGKSFKIFDQNWADVLANSDRGSSFELFALDEEDVWYYLSITFALSPFEAVTVTS